MSSDTEAPAEPATEPSSDAEFSAGLQDRDVLPLVIGAAAIAAGLSGQQPTGNVAADFVLSAFFGGALVWLSRWAAAQAIVVSAVLALFFTGMQLPVALLGIVAAASAVGLTSWRKLDRDTWNIGAALSVAFTSQTVLHLPSIRWVGTASLLAAVAIAPIAVTALQRLPAEHRTRGVRVAGALLAFAVVATLLAGVAAFGVRGDVESGIEQAQDGVSAIEAGDQERALALLETSQVNFERASNRLGGPLTWPARFVPIVAQHARALETASDQGAALAQTAARVVTRADVEEIRGRNGAIDLEIVNDVHTELTRANLVLQGAQRSILDVRTAWLLPQLDDRLESVLVELAETNEDIDLANHATAVLPNIMGAQGARQYLVLFVQPAESREFGGFVGAYGILRAEAGRFDLTESGSIGDDFGSGTATARFTDPDSFPWSYLLTAPDENPQNLTTIADLSTIARAARDLAPQWRQDPDFAIDGVITIDPYAMAALLELTGPIAFEGRDDPITSSNVVDFLLREQYLDFEGDERDERQDLLKVLAGQAFESLLTIDVPGPERLGALFGPVARSNRLGFVTFDDAENAFLDRVFLSSDLPRVPADVDFLGVYTGTATASKLDAYTTRALTYVVDVDPSTGVVTGQGRAELTNGAPPTASDYVLGLSPVGADGEAAAAGTNLLSLSVYRHTPVEEAASSTPFEILDTSPALGYERSWVVLELPLGQTAEVTFRTRSQVQPGRYDLVIPASQSAQPVPFTLIVRPAAGWKVVADDAGVDGEWTRTVDTDTGNVFALTFERTG